LRDLTLVADGFFFLEGPRWRDGALFVSDFFRREVLVFPGGGSQYDVLCRVPQRPSGLGFMPDGTLLVVSMGDRKLLRLSAEGLVEHADLSALAPADCNDMVVDRDGRAYVGNFGWDSTVEQAITSTVLVRVDPDGRVAVAADDLVFPNGCALADGGRTLLVAETYAGRISAFDVGRDGELGERRIWADFALAATTISEAAASGAVLPDGIALDAEGLLWVADAGGSGALRVGQGGEVVERVTVQGATVYAVALGGEDGRTLYLCCGPALGKDPRRSARAALWACRIDVPGADWIQTGKFS
jgi:sugar lactone lactonase YvrE